ncbi:MAG: DNA phosphorothioation system sulfurtransferase DndC, partial [Deltaproteobacteria bacterium]
MHIFSIIPPERHILAKVHPQDINSSYFLIDIRDEASYSNKHIKTAINLQEQKQIEHFLRTHNKPRPLLYCTTSTKAKNMALELSNEFDVSYIDASFASLSDFVEFEGTNLDLQAKIARTKQEILTKYQQHKKAWIIAFSGGKDSTCVLQLVYEMICSLPKNKLNPTYAIVSNTLVEAPVVEQYLLELIDTINQDAKKRGLDFHVILVEPNHDEQFWVNLIGKGYPSPTRTFRWCTDRLKIRPTQRAVEKIVAKHRSAILMLGVRKSESANRLKSIQKRTLSEDGFNKHDFYPNTLIYSPIVDWTLDDVWGYLTMSNAPWNKSHSRLFAL